MKSKILPFILVVCTLLTLSKSISGQAPNLGTAANFVLFTSVGAVGNTGISQLTGNVGTNTGATTGFGNVNGVMHNGDAVSAQCATDLQSAWYQLDTTTPTSLHIPVLGNGETLHPGVYLLAAAGSLVSVLTLDAMGDSSAVFIFKTGGAFTTAASSAVVLVNGAVACNVFWKAEGAISLAASTIMKGTMIAHNGAIDLGASCFLEGRAFSTTGAATVYGTTASIPVGCGAAILTGPVAPNLGSVQCFTLFSASGTVSNSGITNVTGDIGTNNGLTTGYNPLLVTGMIHPLPDLATAACQADLSSASSYLSSLPYDIELLYPAQFGNGLVLTPHIYRMNAAAAFTDTLLLNAEGNNDAVFVIQVIGALSTSSSSIVSLMNGAQAKNVFWIITGAVTIGSSSSFCGNVFCTSGAIVLQTGVLLNGRAATASGDVTVNSSTAQITAGFNCLQLLPVRLTSFTGSCSDQKMLLQWTTSATDNHFFTVERSDDGIAWQNVGTTSAKANVSPLYTYSLQDAQSTPSVSYYRLQQTTWNGDVWYSKIISAGRCSAKGAITVLLYPNPSSGKFNLSLTGDGTQVNTVEIFGVNGERIGQPARPQNSYDLSSSPTGIYLLKIQLPAKTIFRKILIEK